jgi:SPX domain protein involved in polyphosphate accumulation
MKFGKELLRAVAASESVVSSDKWLDYKVLKKMLKKMPEMEAAEGVAEAEKIVNSQAEREFFRALSNELNKVDTRFIELKANALRLAETFASPVADETLPQTELHERLSQCAQAHLFVLLVENYAVLNYCGFTKILKKHDKLRSTRTRDRYMAKMVNERSFAKFDDVRTALQKLEVSFDGLNRLASEPRKSTKLDAQRREMVDINMQGMDRLKSLAHTALLSLEEHENSSDADTDQQNVKRQRM